MLDAYSALRCEDAPILLQLDRAKSLPFWGLCWAQTRTSTVTVPTRGKGGAPQEHPVGPAPEPDNGGETQKNDIDCLQGSHVFATGLEHTSQQG